MGDTVKINSDLETVKVMQKSYGGWVQRMTEVNIYVCVCVCVCVLIKDILHYFVYLLYI